MSFAKLLPGYGAFAESVSVSDISCKRNTSGYTSTVRYGIDYDSERTISTVQAACIATASDTLPSMNL